MALARTREALHNGWGKNDPKDAQVIRHMLGTSTVYSDPGCGRLNDLQELSKTHDMVSRAKTELWHRLLTHYLPLYFPEAERFQGNSRSDWFLAMLEQFPTPASITALSKEAFVEAAWDLIGRKVAKARLLGDIYETARSSMALPVRSDSPAIAMFRLVAEGPDTPTRPDRGPGRGVAGSRRRRRTTSSAARYRPHHRPDHTG
jgi:hypothetical protein